MHPVLRIFLAAGAVAGEVQVNGLGKNSIQGDVKFTEALELMGAEIHFDENSIIASNIGKLKAIDLDCNHIPDAAMTLAILALFADGTYHITQYRQLARQRN